MQIRGKRATHSWTRNGHYEIPFLASLGQRDGPSAFHRVRDGLSCGLGKTLPATGHL